MGLVRKISRSYFLDHPSPNNIQKGTFNVKLKNHWATQGMPNDFEKSYKGGKNGENHPMSWYQEFDGGRSFYTAMGHTDETFSDPIFLNHLWAGILYSEYF
jgi:cytochrome c